MVKRGVFYASSDHVTLYVTIREPLGRATLVDDRTHIDIEIVCEPGEQDEGEEYS
jgi:hypothetical protein